LRTLFATLSLHDALEIAETRAGVHVLSDHPGVPNDETNLAHRAAVLMQDLAGPKRTGVSIRIRKRIAIGGGLGGGSSNAAAVLRALDLMWGLGLGQGGLLGVAKTLGADVPYFLHGGPALGLGRGDEVFPLNIRLAGAVLLVPGPAAVSTAAVFRRFEAAGSISPAPSAIEGLLRRIEKEGFDGKAAAWRRLRNDLERSAVAESPPLAALRRRVRVVAHSAGASLAAMSGSGSSFFLLFDERGAAKIAAAALQALGVPSLPCSFISREAYEKRFEIAPPARLGRRGRKASARLLR
jgi:4-diphosphocytidyl-2-C-methyl-D-erythritol kinase